jgi:GxxExxY protein
MKLHHAAITERIIGCAIAVHKGLGPGLLESAYEAALAIEFDVAGLAFDRQIQIAATYRNRVFGHYRADFIVERLVVVEVKAVDRLDPVFDSQMLTYLRASRLRVGLLVNFNVHLVSQGIRRFVL